MADCLVTGAAGFMGAHLTRDLLDAGHNVVAVDDLSGGFRENVDDRADFHRISITDHVAITSLVGSTAFECVFHLAAYAAEGLSPFIKRFNYHNNLIGSVNLINAAVNTEVRSFVFTSSIAVYGSAQVPMTERMIPRPEDSYGIAKYAVEQELAVTSEFFGLDYVIFRPHNVYGELQNIGDRYRNVIGIFINQVLQSEPLTIFGDGTQRRAFSHVRDVIPAIAAAPWVDGARNEVFNIGADSTYTVLELADVVRHAMGKPDHPIRHLPARREVLHAFSDHTKVASVFGVTARVDLLAGVERMADWAARHGGRPTAPFADIEIERGLPEVWKREG